VNVDNVTEVNLGGVWYKTNDCRFPLLAFGPVEVHSIAFTDSEGKPHRLPLASVWDMHAGEAPDRQRFEAVPDAADFHMNPAGMPERTILLRW
jgi:hypothetical protein